MFSERFHSKLILSYFLVVLISLGVVGFFLDRNLERHFLAGMKDSFIHQAVLIQNQIGADKIISARPGELLPLTQALGEKIEARITLVDDKGKVLADSQRSLPQVALMENHAGRKEIREALNGQTGEDVHYSKTLKKEMLYVALPVKDHDRVVGAVRLAVPLTSVDSALWVLRKTIVAGMFLALGFALILAWWVAGQTMAPIRHMIQVSRRFAGSDFSREIAVLSKDEIGELAVTLNRMARDLENKIREIQTKNQQLEAVFASMVEGVIVVGALGEVLSVNRAVEAIFGVSGREVQGRPFLEVIRNSDIFEVMQMALKQGEFLSKDIELNYPGKKIFQVNAAPVFEKDKVIGSMVVIHDMTEIRRLESMRRDFVANVSHELKTPLTSIKGYVETLLEGALEDKDNSRKFLEIVAAQANRLNQLIHDLLALSTIESQDQVARTLFDAKRLLDKVLLNFKDQIVRQHIEVINQWPNGFTINADSGRMEQVMINLTENAIKFNKPGGFIRFSMRQVEHEIEISVEDGGIGIPAKDIPRIFERFYRVDKARSRELGGTGLGLSIVKHIIDQHHGRVGVESTEGVGSRFWFTLPA